MTDQSPAPTPNGDPSGNGSDYSELEQKVLTLMQQNQKIAAIKLVRERLNCSLKDAKAAVETVARKHDLPESTIKVGCSGMLLLACSLPAALAGMLCCKLFPNPLNNEIPSLLQLVFN